MSEQALCHKTAELTVPAHPDFARCVRMFAANIAGVMKMDVEQLEDIRLAAQEAFVMTLSLVKADEVTVSAQIDDEALTLDFHLTHAAKRVDALQEDESHMYAILILEATCDEIDLAQTNQNAIRIKKHREGRDA